MTGHPYAEGMASVSLHPRALARDERAGALAVVVAMVMVMWFVEIADVLGADPDGLGIEPREVDGLPGIVLAPFLHAGFGHLLGNTVPFVVLGAVVALGGLLRVVAVTGIVVLVAGLGTWLAGQAGTVHLGASGVVFGYAAYLLVRGLYSRRALHLVVGFVVLAVYGTTLLFGFVPTPGVSWQGHLFGAIGGVLAARLLHAHRASL